jgi:hypothetical protein
VSRVRSGSSGRRSCRKFTTEDLQDRGRGYGEQGAEEAGQLGTDERGALDATNCRPDIAHDLAKVDVPDAGDGRLREPPGAS